MDGSSEYNIPGGKPGHIGARREWSVWESFSSGKGVWCRGTS
ncbi:hypothetical protein A6R68_20370 [Neotoma lepida]|uniref:Uncharacterized protein n=1 Tax=Neotoma lepida TaxID=56216 RepID=A0A1A6HSI6_NEOLE|nr:hypothetical protein A6R68_20370 [Neotoma lepida]